MTTTNSPWRSLARSRARPVEPNAIDVVRNVVARENAEYILASKNPFHDVPEALAVNGPA